MIEKPPAELSAGDSFSATSEVSELAAIEAQVDEAAAQLWGIADKKLQEIQRSLEELG